MQEPKTSMLQLKGVDFTIIVLYVCQKLLFETANQVESDDSHAIETWCIVDVALD
jgi:hypothetical protein